jgi:hypothetical protein
MAVEDLIDPTQLFGAAWADFTAVVAMWGMPCQ